MTDFKDLIQRRRSHRQFTDQPVTAEELGLILRAALYAPTSRHRQNWHFTVVDDKATLEKLSEAKPHGATFVKDCAVAIIVSVNPDENECWIEDSAIAATFMQLQAEDLGLGSYWAQMRQYNVDGVPSTEIIRGIVGLPEGHQVDCIIAIGHAADEMPEHSEDDLKWENVTVYGE